MSFAEVSAPVADQETEEVLALLRRQVALFAQLEASAGRQRALVTGDEPGRLLALLADRQKLSSKLARIAKKLEPVRLDWEAYRARLSGGQRAEADRLLSDATVSLQRVIESDERDARVLSVRKEAAARTLRAANSTGQAIKAYREPGERAARLDCVNESLR